MLKESVVHEKWESGNKLSEKEIELYGKALSNDKINPSYYKNAKVECIDALEAATINLTGIEAVCTANAIKYLWRWKEKGGVDDLKKCMWYIEKLITNQPKELS
jgi:hypothetical protein